MESYTIPEFAKKYGFTVQTVSRQIAQNNLSTVTVDGVLHVWDPWSDPQTGTNTAEDIYMLRGVEVAEILGITTRALRYHVAGGGMPGKECIGGKIACVWIGKQRRYCLADVRRFIAARMEKRVGRSRVRAGIVEWALERLANPEQSIPKNPRAEPGITKCSENHRHVRTGYIVAKQGHSRKKGSGKLRAALNRPPT
jgi:hypothetical protein